MAKSKGSSLLIRISHLILIQIIFIFSALALVIFYPQDESSSAQYYSQLAGNVESTALYVSKELALVENFPDLTPAFLSRVDNFVKENSFLNNLDLIYHDADSENFHLLHLDRGDVMGGAESEPAGEFDRMMISYLSRQPDRFVSVISERGDHLKYYIRPDTVNNDRVLVLRVPLMATDLAQGKQQAYLLFLLFLVSALISLLIIHLISDGIKQPLSKLIEAFENTAAGHETYLEEKGDKQICALVGAFNIMSSKLGEKTRELTNSNSQLIKANNNLAESESILTTLVDYSPDAIIVTDLEDHIIIYNQAATTDFGYHQSSMAGKKIANLIPSQTGADQTIHNVDKSSEMIEIICRRKDGSSFPALLVQTTLGPQRNNPIAILYFIKSISESEGYKEMILQLDRIGTRGRMARDIAHEINNYLAVLQGNLELLPIILAKNDNEKFDKKIEVMKDTVSKISNFTDGLTRFSDDNSEFVKDDLNQLVENLIAFLKPQNKYDSIKITTNLSENIPLVEIDAGQIQHLLVNLVRNAAEAVAEVENDSQKWIVISTSLEEESQNISIKVADGGSGIDEELIPRLFVERFSTRRDGNGLGLLTCKNIADNHLGEIQYHNSEESSAVFTVIIPIGRPLAQETHVEADDEIELSPSPDSIGNVT